MTSKMEDDLKNGRQPQKWKTTSKMEDDLKNGRQPQKWTTTSKTDKTSKWMTTAFSSKKLPPSISSLV
jgi:hypothetical protein